MTYLLKVFTPKSKDRQKWRKILKKCTQIGQKCPQMDQKWPQVGEKILQPHKPSQLINHMTYLHHIFVPKSRDSQKWGKMAKNGSKNPKIKKYAKALHKSTILLENQPSSSKTVATAPKNG